MWINKFSNDQNMTKYPHYVNKGADAALMLPPFSALGSLMISPLHISPL